MEHQDPSPLPGALQRIVQLSDELNDAVHRLITAQQTDTADLPKPAEPAAPATDPPPKLSKRMVQFLRLLCDAKGYTYKEIAAIMQCHTSTLRTYRERIFKRYRVKGKAALARWASGLGLDKGFGVV